MMLVARTGEPRSSVRDVLKQEIATGESRTSTRHGDPGHAALDPGAHDQRARR
jgi:hypothetical protein